MRVFQKFLVVLSIIALTSLASIISVSTFLVLTKSSSKAPSEEENVVVESEEEETVDVSEEQSSFVVPVERRYALIIGVDKYPDWAPDLYVCARDARDLATALETYADFPSENVFVMTFEKGDRIDDPSAPTAKNIRAKISELASTLEPDAFLFISLNGHGVEIPDPNNPDKKNAYFCPCDVDLDKLSSFVDRSWIADELEKSRAKRILLMVDACREAFSINEAALSRSLTSRGGLTRSIASAKSFSQEYGAEQRTFLQISSCRSGQRSIEDGENGLFTRALIDGLRGGATDPRTGTLTVTSWFDFAQSETERRSKELLKNYPSLGVKGQKVQSPSLNIGRDGELSTRFAFAEGLPIGIGGLTLEEWKEADALYFEAVSLRKKGSFSEAKEKINEALKLTRTVADDSERKQKYVVEKETIFSELSTESEREIERNVRNALTGARYDDALAILDDALANKPSSVLEELKKEIVQERDERAARAEELLQKGIAYLCGMNKEKIDVDAAIKALEEATVLGNLKAQALLAKTYFERWGRPDVKKAFELAQEPAQANIPDALFMLGEYYYYGCDGTRNLEKGRTYLLQAFEKYKTLAEEGDSRAQQVLGCFYTLRGAKLIGMTPNQELERNWFRKSAEQGNAYAQAYLAFLEFCDAEVDNSSAFLLATKADEQGETMGTLMLALLYVEGSGVEKNVEYAIELFKKAAESGDKRAMICLAMAYRVGGDGVKANSNYAERWIGRIIEACRREAEGCNSDAQYILGQLYDEDYNEDLGVERDVDEAFKWFSKAAEFDHCCAFNKLGWYYQQGYSVAKDEKRALEYYRKASELGCVQGALNLAYCYQNGIGTDVDPELAFKYYSIASDPKAFPFCSDVDRIPCAQYMLGKLYEEGFGVERNLDEAFKWFSRAAESGHCYAITNVGWYYIHGYSVAKDEKRALEYFRKASELGSVQGALNLAYCYQNGIGTDVDPELAFKYYSIALDPKAFPFCSDVDRIPCAQFMLGKLYEEGFGVERNLDEAFKWFSKAAEAGHCCAITNVGWYYEQGYSVAKDEKRALEYYHKALEAGCVQGSINLAYCYKNGIGTDVDPELAFKYYSIASNPKASPFCSDVNLIPCAQFMLGKLYEKGFGVESNLNEAFKWFSKAAESGHCCAINNVGWYYEQGYSVAKDEKRALEYYHKALEAGCVQGAINLANCYLNGIGTEVKPEQAFKYFLLATDPASFKSDCYSTNNNIVQVQYALGNLYEEGFGVECDLDEAFKWFSKAAEAGHCCASSMIGRYYEQGLGVEEDKERAFEYYQKATELGCTLGTLSLGRCYQNGVGTNVDLERAFQYFSLVEERGDAEVYQELAKCYREGLGTPKNLEKAAEYERLAEEADNESDDHIEENQEIKEVGEEMTVSSENDEETSPGELEEEKKTPEESERVDESIPSVVEEGKE